jgi:UDP-glucose 4-epimerase
MTHHETILVTGGAGFIGSWVVDELLARSSDTRIVVLDNLFNGRRAFVPRSPRVSLEVVDLRNAEAVARVYSACRPDAVVHLAGVHFIPYCNAHPAETLAINVVGTQHLLDSCLTAPPRALLIASTAAVYPISDRPNHEDDAPGPIDVYGLTKYANERQLALFSERTDTRCTAARFFNAIGPRETNPHLLPEILAQLRDGASVLSLGNVEPKRDYIFVADLAAAVVDLIERSLARVRIYNIGTGVEHSARQIVATLSEIVGRPLAIRNDPDRVRASDRMHLSADISRIAREIGWQPRVALREGLQRCWESCVTVSGAV